MQFIHDSIKTDAIIERFIEGRELYCAMLGNQRLQVLPVWEMTFANMPDGQHRIATERVKWNAKYQAKVGIATGKAVSLDEATRHACSTSRGARTTCSNRAGTRVSTCV